MILQALCEYYDRKAALGTLPPIGREWNPIPYLVVIDKDGDFIRLESTQEGKGKNQHAKKFLVCHAYGRSGRNSWEVANSLWDHYGYVFGFPAKMDFNNGKSVETGKKQCGSFQKELRRLLELNLHDRGLSAVLLFYKNLPNNIERLEADPLYSEAFKKDGTIFAFRLIDYANPVGTDPSFNYGNKSTDSPIGLCLVTGTRQPIALLNNAISLKNGNASGSKLVGFQKESGYDSYHKKQGQNAPISEKANDAYTSALNTLIAPESKNRFFFNKDTIVFWGNKDNPMENIFSAFFAALSTDYPDKNVETIVSFMKTPLSEVLADSDNAQFYVLQLSPNNKCIAVKLWEETDVRTLAQNIRRLFEDLDIVRSPFDKRYLPLGTLLRNIALQNKEENLPQQLFPEMMRAIIHGRSIPMLLPMQTLGRVKADHNVSRARAALLKGYLNRERNNSEKQIFMSLD